MQVSSQSSLKIRGEWTVRERDRRTGLVVAQRRIKNVFTTNGLTGIISGWNPQNMYLAVESNYTAFYAQANPGDTQVIVNAQVQQAGDTQLVLSPGLANQEIVTFSTITGTGPYTYTITGGTVQKTHPVGDPVCRQVYSTDTMVNVVGEVQYDSTNFPNQRMQSPGGYSGGAGNFTIQFYYPGPTLQTYVMICGITDNLTIGQGNLWNHFVLGYNHNNINNDLEIDGSLTLANA